MQVTQSILIQAEPETVYHYLMDVERRSEIIPALDDIIFIDPLPLKEGSRYVEVSTIAGRPFKTTYQITRLIKGELIMAKTLKSVFPIESRLIMRKQNGSTLLKMILNFRLTGLFRLAAGIIKGIVSLQAIDILNRVKRNVESLP